MSLRLHHIIRILILGILTTCAAHAGQSKTKILSDAELASIHGGFFCLLEICEDPPGTGVCQPILPTPPALCALVKCSYEEETIGNVTAYGCLLTGEGETCTTIGNYRQCIWAFKASICTYSGIPECGKLAEADCLPDVPERLCVCAMDEPGENCDWSNCLP